MADRVVLFDIDGTIADCTHRLHHIRGAGPKDWISFFAPDEIAKDAPIQHMVDLVATINGTWPLGFVTGRPKRVKWPTIHWIEHHMRWIGSYSLLMREDQDRRPSADVKRDHLADLRGRGIEPVMVFEDRAEDAAMWRAEGVPCLHVAEGAY